jgi:hypothetical protein
MLVVPLGLDAALWPDAAGDGVVCVGEDAVANACQ